MIKLLKNNSPCILFLITISTLLALLLTDIATVEISSTILFLVLLFSIGILSTLSMGKTPLIIFVSVFVSGLLINLLLYHLYSSQFGIPYMVAGSDALQYENEASMINNTTEWYEYFKIRGNILHQDHNSVGYAYIVSLIMRFGNLIGKYHTFMFRAFNVFILAFLSVIMYRISLLNLKYSKKQSFIIGVTVGVFPIMVYVSSSTFRDILVSFIVILVYYLWSKFGLVNLSKKVKIILLTSILIFVLWEIRQFSTIIAILIIFFSLLDSLDKMDYRRIKRYKRTAIFLGIIIIAFLFMNGQVTWFFIRLNRYFSTYSQYRALGSDVMRTISMQIEPIRSVLKIVYFYSFPPITINASIDYIWIGIGTAIRFLYFPYLVSGTYKLIKEKKNMTIVFAYFLIFTTIALTSLTFRHIVMFFPFELLLASYGLINYKRSKAKIMGNFLLSYSMILGFLFLYTTYQL